MMAVSDYQAKAIRLYSLPDGDCIRTIGGPGDGPGQFYGPRKLCFGPNGNLLVAENDNRRIQEVTVMGDHVRFVGDGVIQGLTQGVAASASHIACVGIGSNAAKVRVFDFATGDFLHSFGENGSREGQLSSCWGLRFTLDGTHILIADSGNNRLPLFTVSGDFVKTVSTCLDNKFPRDVDFTECGDVVVCGDAGVRVLGDLVVNCKRPGPPSGDNVCRAACLRNGRLHALFEDAVAVFE